MKCKISYITLPVLLLGIIAVMSSCSHFLDEFSTDERYVENPKDLDYLMMGEAYLSTNNISTYPPSTMQTSDLETFNYPFLHVMDDDARMLLNGNVPQSDNLVTPLHLLAAMYIWAAEPCVDMLNKKWKDTNWQRTYKCIGAINAIIYQGQQMEASVRGHEVDSLRYYMGEAHFLRAFYYFFLTNVYGMPYNRATASKDFSVPLKISETIEDRYFTRNTNEEVWGQISRDLDEAVRLLKGYTPRTKLRAGYYAARALQCRVALYMEDYEKVIECASDFDHSSYQLINLNGYNATSNVLGKSSPEIIFTMSQNEIPAIFANDGTVYNSTTYMNDPATSCFCVSDNLLNTYEINDLRLHYFFRHTKTTNATMPDKYKTWVNYNDQEKVSATYLLRLSEIVLNRAEAEAMLGRTAEARQTLHRLRAMRFSEVNDSEVPTDEAQLVQFIRDERRRELCFEGHRWFDLRRYAVNSKYPLSSSFTITHPYYEYNSVTGSVGRTGDYILESFQKDPAAWVIPVPDETINFNRGNITNLERNARTIHH